MLSFDLLLASLALDGLFSYFFSLVLSMHNPDIRDLARSFCPWLGRFSAMLWAGDRHASKKKKRDLALHESDAVWIFCDVLLIPVSEYLAKAPRLPQRLPQMGLTGLAPSIAYAHARR